MNSWKILLEEMKKALPHLGEEDLKAITTIVFDSVIPRTAIESTNATEKAIFTGLLAFAPAVKNVLLNLEDKIDNQIG